MKFRKGNEGNAVVGILISSVSVGLFVVFIVGLLLLAYESAAPRDVPYGSVDASVDISGYIEGYEGASIDREITRIQTDFGSYLVQAPVSGRIGVIAELRGKHICIPSQLKCWPVLD